MDTDETFATIAAPEIREAHMAMYGTITRMRMKSDHDQQLQAMNDDGHGTAGNRSTALWPATCCAPTNSSGIIVNCPPVFRFL